MKNKITEPRILNAGLLGTEKLASSPGPLTQSYPRDRKLKMLQ